MTIQDVTAALLPLHSRRMRPPSRTVPLLSLILILTLLIGSPPTFLYSASYDFTLSWTGPGHAFQGYPHYSQLWMERTAGEQQMATLTISGLPAGVVHDFPDARLFCCGMSNGVAHLWDPNGNQRLRLTPSTTTPPGTYPITLHLVSGGVEKTVTFDLTILAAPQPLPQTPITQAPPIPLLADWEVQMTATYAQRCDLNHFPSMSLGWEQDEWYYDGTRVRYQIAAYTNDPAWQSCGDALNQWYRNQVVTTGLTGWRVFPRGLRLHYQRTSEAASLDALRATITNSSYGDRGGSPLTDEIRETAYMIQSYLDNQRAGEPPHMMTVEGREEGVFSLEKAVAYGIGDLDQFTSSTDLHRPFMVGLMLESLIEYYEARKAQGVIDNRIPWIVKKTCDWLWATAWLPQAQAFYYESSDPSTAAPDLNLLIAPAYAWLWRMTGDPAYQQAGDAIFAGGVNGAWLAGGKQFNQNYRWSFDFVNWRSLGITPVGLPLDVEIARLEMTGAGWYTLAAVVRGGDGTYQYQWEKRSLEEGAPEEWTAAGTTSTIPLELACGMAPLAVRVGVTSGSATAMDEHEIEPLPAGECG